MNPTILLLGSSDDHPAGPIATLAAGARRAVLGGILHCWISKYTNYTREMLFVL